MRKTLVATLAGLALALVGIAPASASVDAADWSANGESEILSPTSARLQGENTSIETASLGVNVDAGTVLSFEYELHDGALCEAGAPRLFAVVNGTLNKSDACDGTGTGEESGQISFETDRAGLITGAGFVYDSGRPGHVVVSDLTIDGEPVLFAEPEPEPVAVTPEAPTVTQAVCDGGELVPALLTVPEVEGVAYSHESGPVEAGEVTVTATALDGYVLADGAVSEWTLTVDPAPDCEPKDDPTDEPTDEPDPTDEPTDEPTTEPEPEPTDEPEPTTEPDDEPDDDDTTPVSHNGDDLPDTGAVNPALGLGAVLLIAAGGAVMLYQRRALARR